MAATQTKIRRGTASQIDAMTPVEGEIIADLTNDRLRLGDGVTLGGIVQASAYDVQQRVFNFAVAGGSANAITVSLAPVVASYSQPLSFSFKATATNTGATTINVNGLGTKNIYKVFGGSLIALVAGDIINGVIYEVVYDGVQFQLTGGQSGIVTVGQGDLRTSTGTVTFASSTPNAALNFILPGGEYGFYPQLRSSTGGIDFSARMATAFTSSSFSTAINLIQGVFADTIGLQARQRYVTSSPPFDMGDGDVNGFFYGLVDNSSGKLVATYFADVPPWAYNGPTNITASHQCKATGKKFRRKNKRSIKSIIDNGLGDDVFEEITNEIKNADMALIPHPFMGNDLTGKTVVLFDPMDRKIRSLVDYQNSGGSNEVSEAILAGKITPDNEELKNRCGPKGVKQVKMRFKN